MRELVELPCWPSRIKRIIISVSACFSISVLLIACSATTRLPPVDYSKLQITLTRSACFGTCPDYKVTVWGTGDVEFSTVELPIDGVSGVHRQYSGTMGVQVPGRHRARVHRAEVDALLQKFRDANFFSLRDEYQAAVTDNPTYTVFIDTGHGSKHLIDYVGREVGMPKAVTEIEDAIDQTAGSKRWIEGTPDVIPLLQSEGVKFDGPVGMQLMLAAAANGDLRTMVRLDQLGVDPSTGDTLAVAAANERPGAVSWLLRQGAGRSQAKLVSALKMAVRANSQTSYELIRTKLEPGAVSPSMATAMLKMASTNGNAVITAWLLQQHPDVDGYDREHLEKTALFEAARGECPKDRPAANCDRIAVLKMLLGAGANPNLVRSDYRESVLSFVSDGDVARILLRAGADPNYRDDEGEPFIFSIYGEDAALAMIEAGMSLRAVRPADKMTLRSWANYQKWPRVLAILDKAKL